MSYLINNHNKDIFVLIYTDLTRRLESPYMFGYERLSEFVDLPNGSLGEDIYSSEKRELQYFTDESIKTYFSENIKMARHFKYIEEALFEINKNFKDMFLSDKEEFEIILEKIEKFTFEGTDYNEINYIDFRGKNITRFKIQFIHRFYIQNICNPIPDSIKRIFNGLQQYY